MMLTNSDLNKPEFEKFLTDLREKSDKEIEMIILCYSLYREEMAEAAVMTASHRAMISYELRDMLLDYIRSAFTQISRTSEVRWSRSNPFREYVTRYSDSEIYDFLEDPGDIVKDVYRSLLEEAVSRELIEQGEADRLLREARRAAMTRIERKYDIMDEVMNDLFSGKNMNKANREPAIKYEYWTCPSCGEQVIMTLAVCWNCETPFPEAADES
jgi:hypothetical protein